MRRSGLRVEDASGLRKQKKRSPTDRRGQLIYQRDEGCIGDKHEHGTGCQDSQGVKRKFGREGKDSSGGIRCQASLDGNERVKQQRLGRGQLGKGENPGPAGVGLESWESGGGKGPSRNRDPLSRRAGARGSRSQWQNSRGFEDLLPRRGRLGVQKPPRPAARKSLWPRPNMEAAGKRTGVEGWEGTGVGNNLSETMIWDPQIQ